MGLDQYAFAVRKKEGVELGEETPEEREQFFYWRKHPDLHGWMEALFRSRGGRGDFNCDPVTLSAQDLQRLEADVRNRKLPKTEGFFFGESFEEHIKDDLEFIHLAKTKISEGFHVYYTSWW